MDGFAKKGLAGWGQGTKVGMAVAPQPAGQRTGLLKDNRWFQRETWSSDCAAAGLRARKGPRTSVFHGVWWMSSKGLCACTERPLAEMEVAQDGVGRQVGPGRGIGKMRCSSLLAVC